MAWNDTADHLPEPVLQSLQAYSERMQRFSETHGVSPSNWGPGGMLEGKMFIEEAMERPRSDLSMNSAFTNASTARGFGDFVKDSGSRMSNSGVAPRLNANVPR